MNLYNICNKFIIRFEGHTSVISISHRLRYVPRFNCQMSNIVILPVGKQSLLYQLFHGLVFCGTTVKQFIEVLLKVFQPFLDTYYLSL